MGDFAMIDTDTKRMRRNGSMKHVRFGIIGFGVQGSYYAGFLSGQSDKVKRPEQIILTAICDSDPARRALSQEKYPGIPVFSDYKDLILSGLVDAVVTTVPHYLHPEMAIFALGHGIHALVEKPAGVYTKQVREMNEFAATKPELTFGIMFNQRTNQLYQKLRDIVQSGELGQIRRSNWIINTWWRSNAYYAQSAWRATWGGEGGGVLVNQAPHQLDLWQWICGVPKKVWAKARFGSHRPIVVENDVTVVVDYGNGATGVLITCTHDVLGTDRLEIDLDRGKIVVEDSRKATIYRFKMSEDEINAGIGSDEVARMMSGERSGNLFTAETIETTEGWGQQHVQVFDNFARHIVEGTPLLAPGTDGMNGVALANAILLSSWLEREIELPVDEALYLSELNKRIAAEGKYPERH